MPNSLIPDPIREVVIGPKLGAALEERVFTPAKAVGSDLSVLAITEPPPPLEIKQSPHGTWWLATNADADPVTLSNGGVMPAPPEVVDNLHSLRRAGVDFDYIFVLHEIPGDWQPGTPLPRMKLATAGENAAPVVAAQEATFEFGRQLLQAVASIAGMAATGAAAVTAGIGSAIAYDPVVLGGIQDPDSELIAWVGLAAWDEVPE